MVDSKNNILLSFLITAAAYTYYRILQEDSHGEMVSKK